MGSGHILVYAFDVLMQIYESAGYSQRDAAISILENNLYGLDIDDRAFQMAYFAVMMKARQYYRRILNGVHRPNLYSIQESNNLNMSQLKYFGKGMSEAEKKVAISQLTYLVDTFQDAKEYGSILSVRECNWKLLERFVSNIEVIGQINLEAIGTDETGEKLWQILQQGECIAKKYSVTITNPPYLGGRNQNAKLLNYIVKHYEEGKADLYSVFIIRCNQFTKPNGYRAMITQHSWMFLSSFEKLRVTEMTNEILNMVHLGPRAFDEIGGEVVQTTAWVSTNRRIKGYQAIYCRLINYGSEIEKENAFVAGEKRYLVKQEKYIELPGLPIAYWFNHPEVFSEGKSLESVANPRQGLKTLDNDYYLKLWFEVDVTDVCFDANSLDFAKKSRKKWFPINHGGDFKQYYGNNCYVVNWENDGQEMKANAVRKYNCITRTITNIAYYFHPGITWSVLCSEPSFRRYGNGFIL